MVDTQLEKYIEDYLKGDYSFNWINYYIVVATNKNNGDQHIFTKYKNNIIIYLNDDLVEIVKIK